MTIIIDENEEWDVYLRLSRAVVRLYFLTTRGISSRISEYDRYLIYDTRYFSEVADDNMVFWYNV